MKQTQVLPLLEGLGIDKKFNGFTALNAVDFHVVPGEVVGIVGPNGAGKTTLFSVLAGTFLPTAGRVRFSGEDITGHKASVRCRAGIVRTHQIPLPFLGMSVFENVLIAAHNGANLRGGEAEDCVVDSLERTQLINHANRPALALGLLDRKRLELARALATRPKIILLDEICGGLTEAELRMMIKLISDLKAKALTIVWIEHILHALLEVIDRLICMNTGAIIADGVPKEVMADKEVISAYLGSGVE